MQIKGLHTVSFKINLCVGWSRCLSRSRCSCCQRLQEILISGWEIPIGNEGFIWESLRGFEQFWASKIGLTDTGHEGTWPEGLRAPGPGHTRSIVAKSTIFWKVAEDQFWAVAYPEKTMPWCFLFLFAHCAQCAQGMINFDVSSSGSSVPSSVRCIEQCDRLVNNALQCLKMFNKVQQCSTMFTNAQQCSTMFTNAQQCSPMFTNAQQCSTMWQIVQPSAPL